MLSLRAVEVVEDTVQPLEPTLGRMLLAAAEPRFACARDMLGVVTMLAVTAESALFMSSRGAGGGGGGGGGGGSGGRDGDSGGSGSGSGSGGSKAAAARRKLSSAEGDHVTLLGVWEQYRGLKPRAKAEMRAMPLRCPSCMEATRPSLKG